MSCFAINTCYEAVADPIYAYWLLIDVTIYGVEQATVMIALASLCPFRCLVVCKEFSYVIANSR